jgi:ADP-ribosylglycohydrolase
MVPPTKGTQKISIHEGTLPTEIPYEHLGVGELITNGTMTHAERVAIQIENARRKRAMRIQIQIEQQKLDAMWAKTLQQNIQLVGDVLKVYETHPLNF